MQDQRMFTLLTPGYKTIAHLEMKNVCVHSHMHSLKISFEKRIHWTFFLFVFIVQAHVAASHPMPAQIPSRMA